MSTPSGTPVLRRPLLLLWALAAALPVLYILSQVIASSRNIVFWDEFNSLDFVLRLDRHLGWRELIDRFFSIDSEHRTVTTRLIFALTYWVTGSINFHLIGAIGNLSLVALCAVLIARMESADRRARFAVVIAFGLFQLEHFESFVWSVTVMVRVQPSTVWSEIDEPLMAVMEMFPAPKPACGPANPAKPSNRPSMS